jgi:hypothetical protein
MICSGNKYTFEFNQGLNASYSHCQFARSVCLSPTSEVLNNLLVDREFVVETRIFIHDGKHGICGNNNSNMTTNAASTRS